MNGNNAPLLLLFYFVFILFLNSADSTRQWAKTQKNLFSCSFFGKTEIFSTHSHKCRCWIPNRSVVGRRIALESHSKKNKWRKIQSRNAHSEILYVPLVLIKSMATTPHILIIICVVLVYNFGWLQVQYFCIYNVFARLETTKRAQQEGELKWLLTEIIILWSFNVACCCCRIFEIQNISFHVRVFVWQIDILPPAWNVQFVCCKFTTTNVFYSVFQ